MSLSFAESLGNDIYVIDTGLMGEQLVSCYLVRSEDEIAIIETGNYLTAERILTTLEELSAPIEQVRYIILTHIHLDHAGGASHLVKALPNAQLIVHPSGYKHMHNPEILVKAATSVYGYERFHAMYGDITAIPESRLQAAKENQPILLGKREFELLFTPGHAYHHLCIWDSESQSWFTGDTFGICYLDMKQSPRPLLIPTTTPTQFDPEALKDSIRKLLAYNPKRMFLTHYSAIEVADWMLDSLCQQIDDLVAITLKEGPKLDDQRDLEPKLLNYYQQLVKDLEIPISQEQLQVSIAMDLELNSQGLYYWYNKHHAQAD